ncbi:hypothetical protein CB0940_02972 [Cercospora beticola]|uniref:Uncharacterized protein n=1 Tax=Cercospora beticola TaxID=122368 RepID=A0A2G5I2Y9_CERBT|nr:hypothetical protein CB0940_02972 [Cercospora beticola]PIA99174.1 hypothetical protein CB0940_02972 [Cercospora beticola]WPB00134.1 hypothetical protein RHO25_004753 [Cercospora beticola]CAK1361681.1 unnamed protein product [Cercospora beticola]
MDSNREADPMDEGWNPGDRTDTYDVNGSVARSSVRSSIAPSWNDDVDRMDEDLDADNVHGPKSTGFGSSRQTCSFNKASSAPSTSVRVSTELVAAEAVPDDVEVKVEEEDVDESNELLDDERALVQREYLISDVESAEMQLQLLFEDTRWRLHEPLDYDEYDNVHYLSQEFARSLLSDQFIDAPVDQVLDEFQAAMSPDLAARFARFDQKVRAYDPASAPPATIDVSTVWPAGDGAVLDHFQKRLKAELEKIENLHIPDTRLKLLSSSFSSPFACLMSYPCKGRGKFEHYYQIADVAFPSIAWSRLLIMDFPDELGSHRLASTIQRFCTTWNFTTVSKAWRPSL